MKYVLPIATLLTLIAFPVSWFAPLLRAGLLPLFGMSEISVVSGLQSLWDSDVVLALVVTFFALFAPMAKLVGLLLLQSGLASPRIIPALDMLAKLSMADIFLIALYIVLVKGIGLATVETAWGLYMFSGLVVVSILLGIWTARTLTPAPQMKETA